MPFFDGYNIFGTAVEMVTGDLEREDQRVAFFGLDGVARLDGGHRGYVTLCRGLLYGTNLGNLVIAQQFFRSFKDGRQGLLVDTEGVTWLSVVLADFRPVGRLMVDAYGRCFKTYQARFDHMI